MFYLIKTFTLIKNRFSFWCVIFILPVCGCSVNVSQGIPLSPAPQINTLAATPAASSALPTNSPPAQNPTGGTGPVVKIPMAWSSLNLTGKLIYIAGIVKDTNLLIDVQSLTLATGEVSTIFQAPSDGWIDAAAISPDGKQLIISYSPPDTNPHGGQETLYSMPPDGSGSPQLLFTPDSPKDHNYQPVWSPGGKYVYFAQINYQASTTFEVMRVAFPNGKPEKLVDGSYWPRISGDGVHLVYVSVDSQTAVNRLFIARADGTVSHQVLLTGPTIPVIIDAPMFSADDQSIIFSAPDVVQSSAPGWMDEFVGITTAWAADGSIPSDWWSVPITGGKPEQLTHTHSLALYGSFSPDKNHIASYTSDAIFVMNPDGTGITSLVNNIGGIPGTVNWVP
jgi:Tol biopolymer transport system component